MTTKKVLDHNVETGEVNERNMTPEELTQLAAQQAEDTAREAARTAAAQKLLSIGLNIDDLKALGL